MIKVDCLDRLTPTLKLLFLKFDLTYDVMKRKLDKAGWHDSVEAYHFMAMSEMHWIHFSYCTKFSPTTIDPSL